MRDQSFPVLASIPSLSPPWGLPGWWMLARASGESGARGRRASPQAEQCVSTLSTWTKGSPAEGAGRHPETP